MCVGVCMRAVSSWISVHTCVCVRTESVFVCIHAYVSSLCVRVHCSCGHIFLAKSLDRMERKLITNNCRQIKQTNNNNNKPMGILINFITFV